MATPSPQGVARFLPYAGAFSLLLGVISVVRSQFKDLEGNVISRIELMQQRKEKRWVGSDWAAQQSYHED